MAKLQRDSHSTSYIIFRVFHFICVHPLEYDMEKLMNCLIFSNSIYNAENEKFA